MDFEFWNNCWQRAEQPFHLLGEHPFLKEHLLKEFEQDKPCLVPFSGKSYDLLYLAEKGYSSVAVEFNPVAIEKFIAEHNLRTTVEQQKDFTIYKFESYSIWQADFFKLQSSDVGQYQQIFDRAAIIALPPNMQLDYAEQLLRLAKRPCKILLATLEYDPRKMSGPPFLISQQQLTKLFPGANIELLQKVSFLEQHPRWRELELDYLDEVLYRITLD